MPTRRHPRAPSKGALTLHERLIRAAIAADPRMCRNCFWQSVQAIAKEEGIDEDEIITRDFRPDAYLIDYAAKEINIIEVEVSCPLTEKKQEDYAWFWFLWESERCGWIPRLFVIDRYGNGNELGLRAMYYAKVQKDAVAA